MTPSRLYLAIAATLFVAGCLSSEEARARTAARHDAQCREWGTKSGTDAYARCRFMVAERDRA